MRKLAEPHVRRRDADAAHQLDRALERGDARGALVAAQHLGHLRADRESRIEAGHRLLEDHRHAVAADARHLAVRQRQQIGAGKVQPLGACDAPPRASRLIIASAVTDLPQPDSPTRQWVSPFSTRNEAPRTAAVRSPKVT